MFSCVWQRGKERRWACVFVSVFFCMWEWFFSVLSPSSLRTDETVPLWKKLIWKTASALDQKPTDLLSSAPRSTFSPSSNETSQILPPYRAPLCHLNPMLGTHGIFNNGHVSECQCLQVFQRCAVLTCLLILSLWHRNTRWVTVRERSPRLNGDLTLAFFNGRTLAVPDLS